MESHAASHLASRLVPALRDTQNNLDWKGSLKVILPNLHLKAGQTLSRWIGACPFDRAFFKPESTQDFNACPVTAHLQEDPAFFLYTFLLVRDGDKIVIHDIKSTNNFEMQIYALKCKHTLSKHLYFYIVFIEILNLCLDRYQQLFSSSDNF